MVSTRMRRGVAALGLVGVGVLSACGGSGDEAADEAGGKATTPSASVSSAPSSSAPAGQENAVGARLPVAQLSNVVAAASAKARSYVMRSRTVAKGQTTDIVVRIDRRADGLYADEDLALAAGKRARAVITPKAAYMDLSRIVPGLPARWVKIDYKGSDPLSKSLGPVLQRVQDMVANPGSLQTLPKTAQATVLGHDTVAGVAVTRYQVKGTITREQAVAFLPAGTPLSSQILSSIVGSTYQTVIVKGDADGLPRSMTTTNTLKGALGTTTSTVTFSDWGKPVSITVPPASQVMDASDLG